MFADRTNWNLDTNRLSEALARYRAIRRPLLDLTASNPTECGFDYDRPAIMRALSDADASTISLIQRAWKQLARQLPHITRPAATRFPSRTYFSPPAPARHIPLFFGCSAIPVMSC